MSNEITLTLRKLKESDIYLNKAISFKDPDGVVVNLEKSWKEIVIALITCVNSIRKDKSLIEILSDLKMFNGKLLITKGYVENHSFKEPDSYGIYGTDYYVMCDYNANEYLIAIKKLCKFLGFDDKYCYISMEPKRATVQDIENEEKLKENNKLTRIIPLKDIYDVNLSKLKVVGIVINNKSYKCKSLIEAIKIIVTTDITKIVQLYSLNDDKVSFGLNDGVIKIKHQMSRSDIIALLYKVCSIYNLKVYEVSIIFR